MNATEFLKHQLEDGLFQLEKCVEGLDEKGFDTRPAPNAMSPREIVEHLCECYVAFIASAEGREHSWGTYSIEDKSSANLMKTFRELRAQAAAMATDKSHGETLKHAHAYIVAHDNYHVGQLALARLTENPEWNPYSIYRAE